MPQVDAEFELMIGPFNGPDRVTVECALTSPALDPAMHQGASLAVEIDARRETVEGRWSDSGPGFALESFHLQSLLEYLRIQDYIREILEREMARDQEEVDDQGDPVRGEVWEWARVELLELRSRDVHSAEMIEQLRKADVRKQRSNRHSRRRSRGRRRRFLPCMSHAIGATIRAK